LRPSRAAEAAPRSDPPFAGHFPLSTRELLDADFTTFTVLRDPVERTLSYLRQHRELNRTDWDLTLEEMTDGMMTLIDLDRGRLEQAKEALGEMGELGFQEDLEGFAQQLEQRWGWRLGGPRHDQPTTPVKVSRSLRRRIAEDTALDRELYEHARELARR
jgi:hypothetical protein